MDATQLEFYETSLSIQHSFITVLSVTNLEHGLSIALVDISFTLSESHLDEGNRCVHAYVGKDLM